MAEGDLSLVERQWAIHGIFMNEVTPCKCDARRIFAAPQPDERGRVKIECTNCGKRTGYFIRPEDALVAWNRKAQI